MRLNVDVTVAADSPPAPSPVESFTDMVYIRTFSSCMKVSFSSFFLVTL